MIELRRHSDGSPVEGVDVVPDRSVRLREQLASVMSPTSRQRSQCQSLDERVALETGLC